jgi:hypothetical protein
VGCSGRGRAGEVGCGRGGVKSGGSGSLVLEAELAWLTWALA